MTKHQISYLLQTVFVDMDKEIYLFLERLLLRPHCILFSLYQGQTPAHTGGWERQDHQSRAFRAFLSISIDLSGLWSVCKPIWAHGSEWMLVGYSSVTWAPGHWWHSPWWKSSSHSWSPPHTDSHLSHKPEPQGPAACSRQQGHYSWGRRCCACARSPSHCRLQEAAGRWRCSPHSPCEEYLMKAE